MKHKASPKPMELNIPPNGDNTENSRISFTTPAIPTNATSRAQSAGNLRAKKCDMCFGKNEFPLFATCNEMQAEYSHAGFIFLFIFYHLLTTNIVVDIKSGSTRKWNNFSI
jgi:hypothetical protein